MPPKKRRASLAPKPPRPPKPPKAPPAWESYSQSFQATQYTHNSLSAVVAQPPEALVASVATQQAAVLIKDIKDELGAIFEARGKTAKDKADEVDETKLPKLLAEEVTKIGLPTIPTLWEPMAAVPKLDFKVVNLPNKLIFTARRAGEPISGFNAGNKSNNLPNQVKDERFAYCILAD